MIFISNSNNFETSLELWDHWEFVESCLSVASSFLTVSLLYPLKIEHLSYCPITDRDLPATQALSDISTSFTPWNDKFINFFFSWHQNRFFLFILVIYRMLSVMQLKLFSFIQPNKCQSGSLLAYGKLLYLAGKKKKKVDFFLWIFFFFSFLIYS